MMRIEQLSYIADIAQTQSMSKTAQNFSITQQGVSDALKKLEKEVDLKLFQRTKYGVLLTKNGQFFAEKGKKMVALHQELLAFAENVHNSKLEKLEGDLFVLAHPRIYQHILPSVIQTFFCQCPMVNLRILEQTTSEIQNAITSESNSLGLITGSENIIHSANFNDLVLEILFADEMVVCVHKDSPLKFQSLLTVDDLNYLPVVTYDFDLAMQKHTNTTLQNKLFISNDVETHRKLVEQGLAVDVMSKFEYQRIFGNDPNFIPIPFPQKEKLLHILLYSKNCPLSPQAEHFIHLLKKFNYTCT